MQVIYIGLCLTPRASYTINFEIKTVKVVSVEELKVLEYSSNLNEYLTWKMKEVRLVIGSMNVDRKFQLLFSPLLHSNYLWPSVGLRSHP